MLSLATAFALAIVAGDPGVQPAQSPIVRVWTGPYFDTNDPTEMEQRLRRSFDLMDADRSGFLSGHEIPFASKGTVNERGQVINETASTSFWLETNDVNRDGKVEWHEMRQSLMPSLIFKIENEAD